MLLPTLIDMMLSQHRLYHACLVMLFLTQGLIPKVSTGSTTVEGLTVPASVGVVSLHRSRNKVIIPPAGRDALYRPGILQPFDFPPEISNNAATEWDYVANNPRRVSVMGPPGFWTEKGLKQQYEATKHLRFAPELFPIPPPFEVWLKEQQMLRAIKMHEDTVKQQLLHRGAKWTIQDALTWEINRAEQLIIFRQLQISIVLKYASLDTLVREYELKMYRFWAGFLENFRLKDIASFDAQALAEQLEGSNNMLQSKLEQYLSEGGAPNDPAYQELWHIYQKAQLSLAELRNPTLPVERPSDFGHSGDDIQHSPSANDARLSFSSGGLSEHEARDQFDVPSFDDALKRLRDLKMIEKFKPSA